MEINDSRGRMLDEVTVHLASNEVTQLLVAASQLDEDGEDHAILRDEAGNTMALYRDTGERAPLERHFDWWLGPLVLVAVILMAIGAFTIAKGIVGIFF